jgi:hypothetical protein
VVGIVIAELFFYSRTLDYTSFLQDQDILVVYTIILPNVSCTIIKKLMDIAIEFYFIGNLRAIKILNLFLNTYAPQAIMECRTILPKVGSTGISVL